MSYASDVLERGRHNKGATPVVDNSGQYRFESYRYGHPLRSLYVRVCPDLDAVIVPGPLTGETYRVTVGNFSLPTKFRKRQKAVEAAVAEAKRLGII